MERGVSGDNAVRYELNNRVFAGVFLFGVLILKALLIIGSCRKVFMHVCYLNKGIYTHL